MNPTIFEGLVGADYNLFSPIMRFLFLLSSQQMLHLAVNHQVAYTKARLKSVLPTEKKKKKESQVCQSGFLVSK